MYLVSHPRAPHLERQGFCFARSLNSWHHPTEENRCETTYVYHYWQHTSSSNPHDPHPHRRPAVSTRCCEMVNFSSSLRSRRRTMHEVVSGHQKCDVLYV